MANGYGHNFYEALVDTGRVFVVDTPRKAAEITKAGYRAIVCAGWKIGDFIDALISAKEYDERVTVMAGLIFLAPLPELSPTNAMIDKLEASGIQAFPRPNKAECLRVDWSVGAEYFGVDGENRFLDDLKIAYGLADVEAGLARIDYVAESMGSLESRVKFNNFCERRAGGGIKTGFECFDSPHKGFNGLRSGLYVLGAMSSAGKTSLIMQIAENVAADGVGVVVLSLETKRETLRARGIVRASYLNAQHEDEYGRVVVYENEALTMWDVVDNRRNLTKEQQDLYNRAVERYEQAAKRIWVRDASRDVSVRTIDKILDRHVLLTGGEKFVLVIDYLHLLKPLKPNQTDKQKIDEAVSRLQNMATKYDVPIIAVSAISKQANYTSLTLESFRESSAIGYSAEVALGLQARGMFAHGYSEDNRAKGKELADAAMDDEVRRCEVVILKDKEGKQSRRIVSRQEVEEDGKKKIIEHVRTEHVALLDFHAKFFHFEEVRT